MTDILKRLRTALGDRYEIEREVGAGGMATVYSAQDLRHERKVALKVLRPGLAATVGPERFLREIKTTAGLSHPHIVPLHDSGEADGFLYYVMPYIEGESLRDRLQREGQLPLDEALEITCEVADALSYAHSLGVIHRDVKPENILLEGGHAVVTDFGIARAVAVVEVERLTGTGLAVGTPSYMSPEQAGGEERIDGRSDVYSLACVLYEMLAGEAPYTGPTPQAILARQITGEVRSLQPVRTSVGPDLDAAILRGLSPAPADRQATVTEFAKAVSPRAFAPLGRRSVQTIFARRPLRLAFTYLAVLAVVVAAIAGSLVLLRVREVAAGERPVTLAIYPFRATGPEAGTLGEGVADLLAAAIDGTVGMAVSDPTGLWRALRSGGESPRVPEIDEAAALTQATGAPAMVLGSLTAVAGRIDVNARIYDAGGTLKATVSASTPAESLPYAVDRLAIDVVAQLWERDTLPTVPVIEGFATQSIDALQAYLEAKSLKRRGLYERAETAVRQAVEFDSTFALAHMELFDLRSWNLYLNARPFTGLTEIIDRAMRHRERLTPRNRLRVEAYKAMDETNGARAASRLERIIQIDSLDIDALHALAFVYLRDGWQLGKGLDDVIAAYRHAVAVDSGSIVGHAMLSWLAVVANDPTGVERSLERLRSLDTLSPFIQGQLGVHRAAQALPAERGAILRELAAAPVPEVFTVLRGLRALRPQLAERFVAELLVDTMPVFHHRIGMGARTQLWMAEGKIVAADSVLRSGELDRIRPTVNRFFVAAALLGVGDSLDPYYRVRVESVGGNPSGYAQQYYPNTFDSNQAQPVLVEFGEVASNINVSLQAPSYFRHFFCKSAQRISSKS